MQQVLPCIQVSRRLSSTTVSPFLPLSLSPFLPLSLSPPSLHDLYDRKVPVCIQVHLPQASVIYPSAGRQRHAWAECSNTYYVCISIPDTLEQDHRTAQLHDDDNLEQCTNGHDAQASAQSTHLSGILMTYSNRDGGQGNLCM
jgi:hypothetical protein